jgi:hypothetical protein
VEARFESVTVRRFDFTAAHFLSSTTEAVMPANACGNGLEN